MKPIVLNAFIKSFIKAHANKYLDALPVRKKYTKRDISNVLRYSLFNDKETISLKTAVFIVKLKAKKHNAACSKNLEDSFAEIWSNKL